MLSKFLPPFQETPPREKLLLEAPARPKLRERATIERAFELFAVDFRKVWGEVDYDKLRAHLVTSVEGATDPWSGARWLEGLGWAFNHDAYMTFVAFWRGLERARIEREIEWVVKHGSRFPARPGQTVAFSYRGSRLSGLVKEVDRPRARGIVEAKRYGKDKENFSVDAECVMAVTDAD